MAMFVPGFPVGRMIHARRLLPVLTIGLLVAGSANFTAADIIITQLLGRQYVTYNGGYAIQSASGAAGNSNLTSGLSPPSRHLMGTAHEAGDYNGHQWSFDVSWNLVQSWAHTDHAILSDGALAVTCVGTDVFGARGWNNQEIYFVSNDTTNYHFGGDVTGGQWVDFLKWNPSTSNWDRVYLGIGGNFSKNGSITAGLYRVIANPNSFVANLNVQPVNDWQWTLTFPDALVSVIPEPGAFLLVVLAFMSTFAMQRNR
jgi:hypothetical protein